MPDSQRTVSKLDRIETLIRVLAVVVIVAGSISTEGVDARLCLGAAIAYMAWIVISTSGARLGIHKNALKSWWVVAVDMVLITLALVAGRRFLDEIAVMSLMVPIAIMTLRGKLWLSVAMAMAAAAVACFLVRHSLARAPGAVSDSSIEVIAHTLAWGIIFLGVAFSSRAGYKFLQVTDLHVSEAELRLETLLNRSNEIFNLDGRRSLIRRLTEIARELFEADSASILVKGDGAMQLAGLSRSGRYLDPHDEPTLSQDTQEHMARVSIADYVVYNDVPLLLNADIGEDPRFRNLPSRSGIHSSMSVPIKMGGEVIAVLNITQLEEARPSFSEGDLRVARVLAYLSAIALSRYPS